MGIWNGYADFVYRIATGNKGRRMLATPLLATFYIGLIVLFVFASFWVDRWLVFPHFSLSWWTIGLSVLFLAPGCLIWSWTMTAFLRSRGTPVPLNPPQKLITIGLYTYMRNPMITSLFLLMFGLGVLLGSLSLVFIFTPLFIVLNVLYIKFIEEKELGKRFGTEYFEYKKKVPMFIPRVRNRI